MEIQSVGNSAVIAQAAGRAIATGEPPATSSPAPAQQPTQAVSAEQTRSAVDSINSSVQAFNSSIEFSVDAGTGIDLVKVVDKDSKKVILQLPLDAVINFARSLDPLQGLLIKQKV